MTSEDKTELLELIKDDNIKEIQKGWKKGKYINKEYLLLNIAVKCDKNKIVKWILSKQWFGRPELRIVLQMAVTREFWKVTKTLVHRLDEIKRGIV